MPHTRPGLVIWGQATHVEVSRYLGFREWEWELPVARNWTWTWQEEEEKACQGDCMSRLLLLSLSSVKWDRVLNANKISNIQIFQFQSKKITGPKRFTSGLGLGLVMGLDNTFTAQSDLLMGVVDVRLLSSYWHLLRLHFHMPKRVLGKGYRKV